MLRKNILKEKDKKGSIIDLFFIIVTIFGLGMFILILAYIAPQITSELKKTNINSSSAAMTALNDVDNTVAKLDPLLFFVFVGFIISILITAFLIDSHPIFIPIYIFLLGFAVVVGVILSNVYDTFSTTTSLNQTATNLTYTNALLNNYVAVIIGVGVLSMIIIFGKSSFGGGRL